MASLFLHLLLLLLHRHAGAVRLPRRHGAEVTTAALPQTPLPRPLPRIPLPPPQPAPVLPPAPSPPPKPHSRVFRVTQYGADPSGKEDSSAAIVKAMVDAMTVVGTGAKFVKGVMDLGGVIIHLEGGNYLISHPMLFPEDVGNIVVQGGSLRASPIFPPDRNLIELVSSKSLRPQTDDKVTLYEDITFRDILFDSSYRGGGLLLTDSARIRITHCFFLHFTTHGVFVRRGHETFISSSFFGQRPTVGGDRQEKHFSGIAIELNGNDHAITDVVVFSAAIGIVISGGANILTGVHLYNKATGFGGTGILVKGSQNRIDNCYLDYNGIVLEDPSQILISNGFFLGDGNIVVRGNKGTIDGLSIVHNSFGGKQNTPIVKLEGRFWSVKQVVVEKNNVKGMQLKSTVGKKMVEGNGTRWVADFKEVLLFPDMIRHFKYSVYSVGGVAGGRVPPHAVTSLANNTVVVESERAVHAVVSVEVDQYSKLG